MAVLWLLFNNEYCFVFVVLYNRMSVFLIQETVIQSVGVRLTV